MYVHKSIFRTYNVFSIASYVSKQKFYNFEAIKETCRPMVNIVLYAYTFPILNKCMVATYVCSYVATY